MKKEEINEFIINLYNIEKKRIADYKQYLNLYIKSSSDYEYKPRAIGGRKSGYNKNQKRLLKRSLLIFLIDYIYKYYSNELLLSELSVRTIEKISKDIFGTALSKKYINFNDSNLNKKKSLQFDMSLYFHLKENDSAFKFFINVSNKILKDFDLKLKRNTI